MLTRFPPNVCHLLVCLACDTEVMSYGFGNAVRKACHFDKHRMGLGLPQLRH